MNEQLNAVMNTPLIKSTTGTTILSSGHLVVAGIGALVLYFMIPEKKRKSGLFK